MVSRLVRCSSSPMTLRRSPGNTVSLAEGILIRLEPRSMLATLMPKRWLSCSCRSVFPAQRLSSGTVTSEICRSWLSMRSSKRGRRLPAACSAMSRERRFCWNILSMRMLLRFRVRDITITMMAMRATQSIRAVENVVIFLRT